MIYTFWYNWYFQSRVAFHSSYSDATTIMRFADNGLGGSRIIPSTL